MTQPASGPTVVVPGQGWVDVASRAVVQVGFPIVVAGVLLWFLLGTFQRNMEAITDRMSRNTEAAAKLVLTAQGEIDELKHQTGHMQKQTEMMADVMKTAHDLVDLHQQELAELRGIRGAK